MMKATAISALFFLFAACGRDGFDPGDIDVKISETPNGPYVSVSLKKFSSSRKAAQQAHALAKTACLGAMPPETTDPLQRPQVDVDVDIDIDSDVIDEIWEKLRSNVSWEGPCKLIVR